MYQALRKLFFSDALCLSDSNAKSYEELFEKLDTNKDGIVDVSELKAGLSSMGISLGKGVAQVRKLRLQHLAAAVINANKPTIILHRIYYVHRAA